MFLSSKFFPVILSCCALAVSHPLKDKGKETVGNASCQKYILLTNQKSGSTWTCNLFDIQDELTCGGTEIFQGTMIRLSELMVDYTRMTEVEKAGVEWSYYQKDLSNAMQNSLDANDSCNPNTPSSSVGTIQSAAGFKLMYNQIPQQFIHNNKILDYFAKNDIAIIHLIREAKILRIAALNPLSQGMSGSEPHTTDKSVVQSFREKIKGKLIIWDDHTIQQVLQEEDTDIKWIRLFSASPKVKYHQLIYESMLEKEERRYELDLGIDFLNIKNQDSDLELDSALLKLHDSTCEGRIDRYEEFRKRIAGTKTLTACEKLDEMFSGEEAEES